MSRMLYIVELKVTIDVPTRGVVVPVYKGSGKDPLLVDSDGGVTLSSMVANIFCLERLKVVFLEADPLHVNQTAYNPY